MTPILFLLSLLLTLNLTQQQPTTTTQQTCHDNISELDDDTGRTLMSNNVVPFDYQNQKVFQFTSAFVSPYKFDTNCFNLEIIFEGKILPQGSNLLNQWTYDSTTQIILWNIKLTDFVPIYGCEYLIEDDQFTWICEFQVNIHYQGTIQQKYLSKLQTTMNRRLQNQIELNLLYNQIEDSCCENELNIGSEVKFCLDFECNEYQKSLPIFERKKEFFVELTISTYGYKDFYLALLSVGLDNYTPIIRSESEQGRIRLGIISHIAKSDLTLSIVCQLQSQARRRFLQISEIDDDYKLLQQRKISILNENEYGNIDLLQQDFEN